jgi:hypothetical protein
MKKARCGKRNGPFGFDALWPRSVQDLAEEQFGALVLRIVEEFGW